MVAVLVRVRAQHQISLSFFITFEIIGNIKFRKLLERQLDEYTKGDDTHKMILVDCLTDQMRSALGGNINHVVLF